jgi:HAD superfamily hydrolase (TIGR01450 family)
LALSTLARSYDHLLLDLDGCVWVGDEPTPRAPEAVGALRAAGKRLCFVTNDARRSTEEFVRKLWRLGFQASLEEVVTVGGALQHRLAVRGGGSAFVIGSPAIHRHVADAGLRIVNQTEFASRADVVIIAAYDELDYTELRLAVQAAVRGAEVLAAGRDPTVPMPDGPWPGTGAIVAAVEYASGRTALSVGKPEAWLFRTALDRLGEGRALVVGDRVDVDLAGAAAAHLDGAVVLSGVSTREDAQAARDPAPVAIADTLADLVLDGAEPEV